MERGEQLRDGSLFASSRDRLGFDWKTEERSGARGRKAQPESETTQKRTELRTRLHHYSLLGYAVPVSRLTRVLPERLSLLKSERHGEEVGWIWVQSFRDEGGLGELALRSHRSGGFEQTTYSVSVLSGQGATQYVLGHAIGSLSAVGARHLWAQPWHLSAMEFQVAWQSAGGRCREYRLQSQSQWDNSRWELDPMAGEPVELERAARTGSPIPFSNEVDYLFSRGGEGLGQRRIRFEGLELQRASVAKARSEFLERSGLVRGTELTQPALAGVQQVVRAVVDLVDGEFGSPVPAKQEAPFRGPMIFQAA
jgi:hypothetical protein